MYDERLTADLRGGEQMAIRDEIVRVLNSVQLIGGVLVGISVAMVFAWSISFTLSWFNDPDFEYFEQTVTTTYDVVDENGDPIVDENGATTTVKKSETYWVDKEGNRIDEDPTLDVLLYERYNPAVAFFPFFVGWLLVFAGGKARGWLEKAHV